MLTGNLSSINVFRLIWMNVKLLYGWIIFLNNGGSKKITIPADMKIGIDFKDKIYF